MSELIWRNTGLELRAEDTADGHTITLQLITSTAPDTFGSLWHPHALDDALSQRMPVLNYSHDQRETIGRAIDYQTSDSGPAVRFLFDDFETTPRARQAWTQVRPRMFEGQELPPAITDCSIAFDPATSVRQVPTPEQRSAHPGVHEYVTRAEAVHVGLVQKGSVRGAKVLAVRSADGGVATMPEEFVIGLARQVAAGSMTQAEALIAVNLAAGQGAPTPVLSGGDLPDATDAAVEAELAELGEALGGLSMDPMHGSILIRKGEPTKVLLQFGATIDVSAVTFEGAIRQSPEPDPVGDALATFAFDMTDAATGDVMATAPAISHEIAYTSACFQFRADGQTFFAGEDVPIDPEII